MYEDDRSRQISINVAINASADITCALIRAGQLDAEKAPVEFAGLVTNLVPIVLEQHGIDVPASVTAGAEALLKAQLGAVVVPQLVGAGAPVQAAPTPIPGASTDPADVLWQDFFHDESGWYDNRNDKKTATSPDFKSKKIKQADGKYFESLWLTGKKPLPGWVQTELRRRGYIN